MVSYPRIINWLTSERFAELFPSIDDASAEIIKRQAQRGVAQPGEIRVGMQKALTDFYEAIEKQKIVSGRISRTLPPIVFRGPQRKNVPLKYKRIKIIKKGRKYVIFRTRRGQIVKQNIKTGRYVHYKVPKKKGKR